MSVDDIAEDTLRGQPFIEEVQKYEVPRDLCYGDSIVRACGSCFYRAFEGNTDGDCHILGDSAKIDFGFKPNDFLPTQVDGKEVAHYCKHFTNFKAE